MLTPGPRSTLVDRSFQPSDRQGKVELALVLWLELLIERCDRLGSWCAARPLRMFVAWSLWLSFLYIGLGPFSYVKVPDCGNGTLPARMIAAQEFVRGDLGNWMDYSGCGTDRVINNFRLEPLCVLLAFLPGWLGYGLIMLAQRFIAGYFFFRVTRDDLKFTAGAAMLTGFAYSLFHQIGIHWQWDGFTLYDGLGIPGLPLLFWLANRLTERRWGLGALGSVSMGVGLALSAPYFQALFFPFLAVFWYTFIQRAWSWKRLALLTCVFVGWAAVSAPEMFAAARFVPQSHRQEIVVRSDSPYVKYIENVQHWPDAVSRSNRILMIVAGIGLACSRLREPRVLLTILAVLGIFSFVNNYHYFNDHFLSHMGILSSFHFHRFIYLVPFLCALAMGLGLMALPVDTQLAISNKVTGLKLNLHQVAVLAVALFVVSTSVDVNLKRWKMLLLGENFTSLYRHPDLLALAEQTKSDSEFRVACVTDMWRPSLGMSESHLWSPNPGVAWAYGFETTDGYQVLYSLRYKQFWSEVLYPMIQRDKIRARQHVYWGNMLFLWHPSEEPLAGPTRKFYNLDLLSLANTKYLISPVPLDDPDLVLLPSKDRARFLNWKQDRRSTSRGLAALRGEWTFRPLYVYENQQCLPRFFLANNVALYDNADALVYDLRSRSVDWLRHNIEVNEQDLPPEIDLSDLTDHTYSSCDDATQEVRVISRTSDRLELEFTATQPCVLFLSNSFDPSWKATLNGASTSIFPANHTFQGVYIPAAGKHRVELSYHASYALSEAVK